MELNFENVQKFRIILDSSSNYTVRLHNRTKMVKTISSDFKISMRNVA